MSRLDEYIEALNDMIRTDDLAEPLRRELAEKVRAIADFTSEVKEEAEEILGKARVEAQEMLDKAQLEAAEMADKIEDVGGDIIEDIKDFVEESEKHIKSGYDQLKVDQKFAQIRAWVIENKNDMVDSAIDTMEAIRDVGKDDK